MVTRFMSFLSFGPHGRSPFFVLSRALGRGVFLGLCILMLLVVLGGCDFFGSNLFPMYLGFTEATFDVRGLVQEVYPNARGFEIRGKYGRYILEGVDYSVVMLFLGVMDQGRLLVFLDPTTLQPIRVIDENEIVSWSNPPLSIPNVSGELSVHHLGFDIGGGLFDPIDLRNNLPPFVPATPVFGQVIIHTFQNTGSPSGVDKTLGISWQAATPSLNINTSSAQSIAINWDEVGSFGTLIDGFIHSDGSGLTLLVSIDGSGLRLLSIDNFEDLFAPAPPTSLASIARLNLSIPQQVFSHDMFSRNQWLVKNAIVSLGYSIDSGRFEIISQDLAGAYLGNVSFISEDMSTLQVLDIDRGDQDRSRWWLLYDRNSGLLSKNRVWWSE